MAIQHLDRRGTTPDDLEATRHAEEAGKAEDAKRAQEDRDRQVVVSRGRRDRRGRWRTVLVTLVALALAAAVFAFLWFGSTVDPTEVDNPENTNGRTDLQREGGTQP